ncbi:MAG TPA: DUF2470 domain-containing protein [Sneathiellales bacterium]|jgi:putative heme iron utilization protein|nr:DUF2470 domain-containing protein [Sneathiellales bacterium]
MDDQTDETGRDVRLLIRRQGTAALGTLSANPNIGGEGWPYTSLVEIAADHDGAPLLLISTLAEHTNNIASDSRVSLLVSASTDAAPDPLAQSRVTLFGHARPSSVAAHRTRFLARHPEAAEYADFADFSFYRMEVMRAHLVAGFGRIHWVDGSQVILPADIADTISTAGQGIMEHMNTEHGDAVSGYATRQLDRPPGDWRLTGCDPDGLDLKESHRSEYARLDFEHIATTPGEMRAALVKLAQAALNPSN